MTILIVDDIATNRKLLRVNLEAEGYSTLEAADGIEALLVLAREPVEAVISDILMPNMDGFRLCLEIRKNYRVCAIPFIIYTSTYTSQDDFSLGKSIGADRFLTKPAPMSAILQALRELLENQKCRPVFAPPAEQESVVLKQYNQTLVNKLQEKNSDLTAAMENLQRANESILQLNSDLELRVKARTAELETANLDLSSALSNIKELKGLLPICGYCKKIRDDQDYWQTVEGYISQHTDASFSHGICPDCFELHVKPDLAKHGITGVEGPGGKTAP
jgi:CheY-like chemotaxis protein